MEEIFDGVYVARFIFHGKKARILMIRVRSVRARLKDILRQYELRERHFECVIRSKELEVLLSRARAAEQKQLAEGEKVRAEKVEEEVRPRFIMIIILFSFFESIFRCHMLFNTFGKKKKTYGHVIFFARTNNFERSWTMRRRLRRC
jgi:hypothetical protein